MTTVGCNSLSGAPLKILTASFGVLGCGETWENHDVFVLYYLEGINFSLCDCFGKHEPTARTPDISDALHRICT